jgi:ABC-type transport system substrate-binding protein
MPLLSLVFGAVLYGLVACTGSKDEGTKVERVMVFARGSDSVGLDPGHEDDGESFNVSCNIYDTLVAFLPGSIQVGAALAEKWEVSQDGKEYTFHLRRNVKFHDGTPFNADAVLVSFLRQSDPSHPYANIGGPYKYWTSTGLDKVVESIEKLDDLKVRFKLKTPFAPFLATIAMDFCSIVSPAGLEKHKEKFNFNPIGTGPFVFDSWEPGQKIVLRANPEYWDKKPLIDRLIFVVIPDSSARFKAYEAGQVDGFNFPNPFEIQQIQSTPNTEFMTQSGLNICYLAMNLRKPPFDNVLVRRAVNHAINKSAIVKNFYQGLGAVAVNPLPPLTGWAHNFDIVDYKYDVQTAKKLLKEAKLESGFETTLWAMSNPRPYLLSPEKVAAAVIADLEAVGIKAQKVTYDWPTYLDKTQHGEHDMALMGWSGDNGDPDNFMYGLLSKNVLPSEQNPNASTHNIAFYASAAFSDLLEQAKVITHPEMKTEQAMRGALYRKAQAVFHEDAPWVPLAHTVQVIVMRKYVQGFQLHPTTKTDFRAVSVEKL